MSRQIFLSLVIVLAACFPPDQIAADLEIACVTKEALKDSSGCPISYDLFGGFSATGNINAMSFAKVRNLGRLETFL